MGAGSAGGILATRLSEDPRRSVLLLEAGADYPDLDTMPDEVKYVNLAGTQELLTGPHSWDFVARTTDLAPPMPVPRGKVTGGSSAINWGAFTRGIPGDFDSWTAMGNDQWSFQKVLPYFIKLETDPDFRGDFHGDSGPIVISRHRQNELIPAQAAFYEACRAAGFEDSPDWNAPDSTGVGPITRNVTDGIRNSTAIAYLSQARHRLNLTIRADCLVHRILFDGRRAMGLLVESGGETFQVEAEEIIVSAGAIGSPHLLMLSGIGPAAHLQSFGIPVVQDMQGVGQNLRDHPKASVMWKKKEGFPINPADPRFQLGLRFKAPTSDLPNDMWISMGTSVNQPVYGQDHQADHSVMQMMIALALAKSAGEIKLQSPDPRVKPYLDYNYMAEPSDRERMRDAVHLCLDLIKHDAFKDMAGPLMNPTERDLASPEALDRWLLREATTYSHVCATCKMGPSSDGMSVVDQYGRVHGLEGIRVADASIMPDCVRAFINATVMMIGERMVDLIKEDG